MKITKEQQQALLRKWKQNNQGFTYRQFRKSIQLGWSGEIMVKWSGMWLGIEKDGYTHS